MSYYTLIQKPQDIVNTFASFFKIVFRLLGKTLEPFDLHPIFELEIISAIK